MNTKQIAKMMLVKYKEITGENTEGLEVDFSDITVHHPSCNDDKCKGCFYIQKKGGQDES